LYVYDKAVCFKTQCVLVNKIVPANRNNRVQNFKYFTTKDMEENIAILMADLSGQSPYRNLWPAWRRRKNISEEKEVFELITHHPNAFIIDPVCRMIICNEANAVQHPEMVGILFCSAYCMDIYRRKKGMQDVN
jgi:hypothetical protein